MNVVRQKVARKALTWVEIENAALIANLHALRRRLGTGVELAHVVKANAYGHGLELVAKEDEASGIVHRLAVNSVEELVRVRDARVGLPVLVLGYVPLNAWDELVDAEGTPVLSSLGSLEPLARAADRRGRTVDVHLKVETGTHRYGIPEDELPAFLDALERYPILRLEGISTHFANIEDTTDHSFAQGQLERFRTILRKVESRIGRVPVPNTACSAATILFPESHFGLARVGIASYGIWPSKETRVSAHHLEGEFSLKPVLTWKTKVAQLKPVPAGGYVGYGCSWRAPVETRLAVLPMGYGDGYDREVGNVGHVLIRGRRAPVRGRVCMNVTMVDVTHIPDVELEDEVVLLGRQGEERITAEDIGGWCGTIGYEIVARIAAHLPRVRVQV
jgi:alanine racemase